MERLITIEIIRHYWGSTATHLIRVPERMRWSKRKSENSDYYNYFGVGCHTDWESRRMEAMHDCQVIDAHCFDNTTWVTLRDIEEHPYLDAHLSDSIVDEDPGDLYNDVWVEIADGKSIIGAMRPVRISHPCCAHALLIKTSYTDFKGRTFSLIDDTTDLTQMCIYDNVEVHYRGKQWVKCNRLKGQKIWSELVRCVNARMMRVPYEPKILLDIDTHSIPMSLAPSISDEQLFENLEHICVKAEKIKKDFLDQFI